LVGNQFEIRVYFGDEHIQKQHFKSADFLPKPKVKASQFPVHISYFLQNCKKGKPDEMDLPSLKNDITSFLDL